VTANDKRFEDELRGLLRVAADEAPPFRPGAMDPSRAPRPVARRRLTRALAVAGAGLAAATVAGVVLALQSDEEPQSSECAEYFRFDGRIYYELADELREPKPGASLPGEGTVVCGDARRAVELRAFPGVDPTAAVMVEGDVWTSSGPADWPDALRALREPVQCDQLTVAGGPVIGTWEDVRTSTPVTRDGELKPPYWMTVRTEDLRLAGDWMAVRITIRAESGSRLLAPADVLRALQQGEPVALALTCSGSLFVADAVELATVR
jgi:hypothetical protein